jgi:hypothetical protein
MTSREIPELLDVDILGDSDTLQAEADAVLESEEPASSYRVADASESIWVTVDPRGRLLDVEISRTWSERMDADSFGDALFGAYTAAMQKAVLIEAAAREERPPPRRRPEPVAEEDFSPEVWLARVRATLDTAEATLRAAARAKTDGVADREVRGRNGYLTMRLRAGTPVGITGGAALANANRGRLREDVLDIFEDADLLVEGETR